MLKLFLGKYNMTIQEEINFDIEWRTAELAELRVILHKAHLTPQQRDSYMRYIIPAIYAIWEGFVKKCISLYSKEINNTSLSILSLHENLLTHAITANDKLALDRARTNFKTQKEFSLYISNFLKEKFPIGGKIPTKSNINSEVLSDILQRFNLGVVDEKQNRKLDKLLRFRNTIAHGDNSIPVKEEHINEFMAMVQDLMLIMFNKIDEAISNKTYLKT